MGNLEIKELTNNIIITINKSINVKKAGLHEPSINEDDIKSVVKTLKSGFISSFGKDIEMFEQNLSKYTNSKYVIAMSSGTSALHISLLINQVKENDEVLVPALTFIATANAVLYSGAKLEFIDIDAKTLNIDLKLLEKK